MLLFLARVQIPPATLWNGAAHWCLCLKYSWPASMSRGGEREKEGEEEKVILLFFLFNLLWCWIDAKSMLRKHIQRCGNVYCEKNVKQNAILQM